MQKDVRAQGFHAGPSPCHPFSPTHLQANIGIECFFPFKIRRLVGRGKRKFEKEKFPKREVLLAAP